MKDIIIFTFANSKEDFAEILAEIQINLELVSIISNKENLEGMLRENRPKIFLINGELSNDLFLDCIDITERAISDFDMDLEICVFVKDRKTPGTIFLSQPKDLKFFYDLRLKKPRA